MIITVAALLLGHAALQVVCAPSDHPAPKATEAVERMLVSGMNGPSAQQSIEKALQMAQAHGDFVGEAEAYFSLAKLKFKDSGRWPQQDLGKAAAACKRGGCEAQMGTALFRWARAVGLESPTANQAIEQAFSLAASEVQRPVDLAEALWAGAEGLDRGHNGSEFASRGREIALGLLQREAALAVANGDSFREAYAKSSIATLSYPLYRSYHPDEREKASVEYLTAAAAFSNAGCRPESVRMLTYCATVLSPGAVNFNSTLDRALSIADSETERPSDADDALISFYAWDKTQPTTQKQYLAVRVRLLRRSSRESNVMRLQSVAGDAERLDEFELANKLYVQSLHSARSDRERAQLLNSLGRVAEKQGKTADAKAYRQRADEISKNLPPVSSQVSKGPVLSPWDPPEKPGSEGGTPGVRKRE